MEACIVICRTRKELHKRGKILFINAVSEVTRKNAQSYLEDAHIEHIASAYNHYTDEEGYARVVSNEEIVEHDNSLNIPLYVRVAGAAPEPLSVEECADDWLVQSELSGQELNALVKLLWKESEKDVES